LNPDEDIDFSSRDDSYTWIHMCALHPETRRFLENDADLDPIIIDALLAEETRPRSLIKEDGMLVILRAMNLYEGRDPEDMISIRIWIDDKKVITTRRRDIKAIVDIVGFMETGNAPPGPGDFLIMITDRVFERMEPFFTDLEDCISKAEELLASGNDKEISGDASLARKRTAIFMRYVAPQKMVLEALLKAEFKWLKEESKEHLVESLDRVTRYVEELHELRDRSQILNDEINNAHGRRLNDITYIFSVAATIFLPLSFLTGLLGINVGGVPGIDSGNAFWLFTGLCTAIIVSQVIIFRKLKWF
jgi:zinc transporter